ncbi:MAG: DUF4062 domain-containing protein [Methanothrix sp.]|nr:DUF4062 domain-containing protein [Methanothrix sp.]
MKHSDCISTVIGMEHFIPDGKTSQEISLEELIKCDAIIFLISPYYGSLIDKCNIKNCRIGCSINEKNMLSYTHCEFKFALSEAKPHQSYIIEKDWDVVQKLKDWDCIDWREVHNNKGIFESKSSNEIEHYFRVAKNVLDFKKEVREELSPGISNIDDVAIITNDLGNNIPIWYSQGKIRLREFCGRRQELKNIIDKMDESVEVFGVGGVGKTTLIHVALLIQKLKGKRIIVIETNQSYLTGSGYKYFQEKCKRDRYEVSRNIITLDDIINALSLPNDTRSKEFSEKVEAISTALEKENAILFIDDFHLANEDTINLIKYIKKNLIIATKKRADITRNQIELIGVDKLNRDDHLT